MLDKHEVPGSRPGWPTIEKARNACGLFVGSAERARNPSVNTE
jgi:hypothetical protein